MSPENEKVLCVGFEIIQETRFKFQKTLFFRILLLGSKYGTHRRNWASSFGGARAIFNKNMTFSPHPIIHNY